MIWKTLKIISVGYMVLQTNAFQPPPKQRITPSNISFGTPYGRANECSSCRALNIKNGRAISNVQRCIVTRFQPDAPTPQNRGKSLIPKCPNCDCSQPKLPMSPPSIPPPTPFSLVPGAMLGIPLNILTWFYTTYQHHGENIMTPQIVILNCLIGTYTYGMDRMMDATAYEKTNKIECIKPKIPKHALYQYILENYDILKNIYGSIYWMFAMIMIADPVDGVRTQTLEFLVLYELVKFSTNLRYTFFSYYLGISAYRLYIIYAMLIGTMITSHWFDTEFRILPFLMAIDTAKLYPELKRRAGWLKAPYVAAMWTGAIAILPNVLHDHNWEVLSDPTIFAPFFGMMGLSNLADLKDIEEDRESGIYTLPVILGKIPAIWVSFLNMAIMVAIIYR